MVWSRDIGPNQNFGRLKTMALIRHVGDELEAKHFRLVNVIEGKRLVALAQVLWDFVSGLITGKRHPLQVLLFSDRRAIKRLVDEIRQLSPEIIYLDLIRMVPLLVQLRKALPRACIVIDFDDLMSRRMDIYRENGLAFNLGYVSRSLPGWMRSAVDRTLKVGWFLRYEGRSLASAEHCAIEQSDRVTVVSSYEADLLRASLVPGQAQKVAAIPPPVATILEPDGVADPVSFCFVGSDDLIQNWLSIGYLLDAWRRLEPRSTLHILGRMRHEYPAVAGVIFEGFVQDLAASMRGKIMLVPSAIGGGIKTKILDGFGIGCPVAGTRLAFEGIPVKDYPLLFEKLGDLDEVIQCPERYRQYFSDAVAQGAALARNELSLPIFEFRWRKILSNDRALS